MNETHRFSPVSYGMRLGVRISLSLACLYAFLGMLVEVVWQIRLVGDPHIGMLPIARAAGLLPFGLLFALGPSLAIGALTGGLIGELWMRIGQRINQWVFVLLALVLCAGLAAGLHLIFGIQVDLTIPQVHPESTEWLADSLGMLVSYPFLQGIPSILYVLAGALGALYFWRAYQPGAPSHDSMHAGAARLNGSPYPRA